MGAPTVITLAFAVPAAYGASRVYAGGSRPANSQMDIALQLLRDGRANWRVDVTGPCSQPGYRLGRTVGTDSGDGDRRLRIHDGRFRISRHASVTWDDLAYEYLLTGHRVRGGFAGTFHYSETEYGIACHSAWLHWRAKPSRLPFP
jgi:hypothetical protein